MTPVEASGMREELLSVTVGIDTNFFLGSSPNDRDSDGTASLRGCVHDFRKLFLHEGPGSKQRVKIVEKHIRQSVVECR